MAHDGGITGGWIREETQRTGGSEVPTGTTLSKSHNSNSKAGILNHSCLPGPKLTGPQAHLVAITQEWNLDDGRVRQQQPAKGGTGPLGGGRECGRGGKGIARVKDVFSRVSVCTAIPIPIGWCLFKIRGSVGRSYKLVTSSQELDSAAGTTSTTHLPTPASTSLRASPPLSSFLPALPFFLSPYLTDCSSKMAQIYGSTHQK